MNRLFMPVKTMTFRSLLALLAGLVSGTAASLFLALLDVSIGAAGSFQWYFLTMPITFFLGRYLVERYIPEPGDAGNDRFLRAVCSASKSVKTSLIRLAAAVLTIASGGSAGRAGPSAQAGAAASGTLADVLHLGDRERSLVILCGISAGFAAVLGAPAAAAVLTAEIMRLNRRQAGGVLYAFIAAVTAYALSGIFGIAHHRIPVVPEHPLSLSLLLFALIGGIWFALVGILMMQSLRMARRVFSLFPASDPWRAAAGGAVLVLLSLAVSTQYLGLGFSRVDELLMGSAARPAEFLFKTLTVSVTLGSGGTGGIITPMLYTGASSGSFLAGLLGTELGIGAALGIVGVLSACANAPAAAVLLAAELFGPSVMPSALICSLVSFSITRTRYFSSQLLLFFPRSGQDGLPLR